MNIRTHHIRSIASKYKASPTSTAYFRSTLPVIYGKYGNDRVSVFHHQHRHRAMIPKRRRREKEFADKWNAHLARLKDRNATDNENVIEIDERHHLDLDECIKRVIALSRLCYDETVDIECQMNLDPRKGNEYIRGNIVLPHGVGRETKICVFLPNKEMEAEALAAGADMIGDDDILLGIGNGSILNEHKQYPFDVIIATPDQLRKMVPFGRQLGPKGLMPNAKLGTLTNNPIAAIESAKRGQVSIRMIDGGRGKGVIQAPVGKCSFGETKIKQNILSFLKQIRDDLRPPAAKKQYFLRCILSSTQGRSYHARVHDGEPWVKRDID